MRASLCLKKTEQEIKGNTSQLLREKHKESTSNLQPCFYRLLSFQMQF